MKQWLIKLLPFLFFATVLCLLFYKVIFLGQVFYEGDNFHLNIPAKYFLVQEISQGIFPLWNPYLFLGIPYFADLNVGMFFPLNFLYFLFSVPRALSLIAVIDIFVIGISQYFFLKKIKLSKIASLLGACIFAFGGMPFLLISNITYLNTAVFIPLIFLISYLFITSKNLKWLFILVVLQSVQFLSGHPQPTYYTMFFVSLYILGFSHFSWRKRFITWGFYIVVPLLLSSFQLIPFIEYVFHATRQTHSISYASGSALGLSSLPIFIFPLLYGNHIDGNWWGPQTMLLGYVGIPTLVLAWFGIFQTTFSLKRFAILGACLSFLLSFGKLTPLFYLFYFLIPGWQLFRTPSSLIIFYTFFMSILAAYGFEYIKKKKIEIKTGGKIVTIISLLISVISFLIILMTEKVETWKSVIEILIQKTHLQVLQRLFIYSPAKIQAIFTIGFWNIIFVSVVVFVFGVSLILLKKRSILVISLFIITVVSLLITDTKIITSTTESLYTSNSLMPKVLSDVQNGQYRLLSLPVNLHQDRKNLPGNDYFLKESKANLQIYKDDNNIERNLYAEDGYTALVPNSYAQYLKNNTSLDITGVAINHVTQEQLNQTSVKYMLSQEQLVNSEYNRIHLPLVYKQSNLYVYENFQAKKRAYLTGEGAISNLIFSSNTITMTISSKVLNKLILTNWYYPGWKAYVNNRKVPIQVYKTTFQEIPIPKGSSQVIIVYDPLSLKIGLIISSITGISLLVSYLVFEKKEI